jgi:hypothetical protein
MPTCKKISVSVSLTEEQREALRAEAAQRGVRVSEVMRGQLLQAADTICEAQMGGLKPPFVEKRTLDARERRKLAALRKQERAATRAAQALQKKEQAAQRTADTAKSAAKRQSAAKTAAKTAAARREQEAKAKTAAAAAEALEAPCTACATKTPPTKTPPTKTPTKAKTPPTKKTPTPPTKTTKTPTPPLSADEFVSRKLDDFMTRLAAL